MASQAGVDIADDSETRHHDTPRPEVREREANVGILEEREAAVCNFFLQGRCHFGDRCRLSHSVLPSTANSLTAVGKEGKHKKVRKKMKVKKDNAVPGAEKTDTEPFKKPRMRPAEDVVSRILWDPSLDPEDFGVGYLDRFLGVLERPFSEFSWGRDLCSCDYTEELALPQHRIKYFTLKGKRVWDRETRLDAVFGSTGGPVHPPFAAGENSTVETSQKDVDADCEKPGESLCNPDVESVNVGEDGCVDKVCDGTNSHVEADTRQEATVHPQQIQEDSSAATGAEEPATGTEEAECKTDGASRPSDSTRSAKQYAGSEGDPGERTGAFSPGLGTVLTTHLTLSETSHNNEEEAEGVEEEWKDSWEADEEKEHLSWYFVPSAPQGPTSTDTGLTQVGALEQRRKPHRTKPTHFITFRADTPNFITGFQCIQKEVTKICPESAPYWVPPVSLHVTLCLLVLSGPQEEKLACEMLKEFAKRREPCSLSLTCPPELGHFNGRVLYLTLHPLEHIQALNRPLQELCLKRGWLHRDSLSPCYHLTLAKMKERPGSVFKGIEKQWRGVKNVRAIDFGSLTVNKLHLCVTGTPKGEGEFYKTLCTVSI